MDQWVAAYSIPGALRGGSRGDTGGYVLESPIGGRKGWRRLGVLERDSGAIFAQDRYGPLLAGGCFCYADDSEE